MRESARTASTACTSGRGQFTSVDGPRLTVRCCRGTETVKSHNFLFVNLRAGTLRQLELAYAKRLENREREKTQVVGDPQAATEAAVLER